MACLSNEKKYACDMLNVLMIRKALNRHEMNERGYNPDMFMDNHDSHCARLIDSR